LGRSGEDRSDAAHQSDGTAAGWERKSELFEFKKVLERASILDDWFLFFISSLLNILLLFFKTYSLFSFSVWCCERSGGPGQSSITSNYEAPDTNGLDGAWTATTSPTGFRL
jgi:hypothetical protein